MLTISPLDEAGLKHMRKILSAVTGVALLAAPTMGSAFPLAPPHWQSSVTLIANGCGGGRYRGPGGACHRFGYGPYPGGAGVPMPGITDVGLDGTAGRAARAMFSVMDPIRTAILAPITDRLGAAAEWSAFG